MTNNFLGGTMVMFQTIKQNLMALMAILLCTCAYAAPVVYVGTIDDSDAQIALVVEDGKVLAYTCGGNATWDTHSSWFPMNDQSLTGQGTFELTGAKGHVLQGIYSTEGATGTLILPDGNKLVWTAELASDTTPAGLYLLNEKTDDVENLIGFIVTNSLQTVGNIRHILPRMSTTAFAPVGLAQALPEGSTESVSVCFTVDEDPECKDLARVSGTGL
jgi:hypothetical protein